MEKVKDNSQLKRILKIILTVLYYVFIVFLLSFSIITIASKEPDKIPSIFGRGYLIVASDSMNGDMDDSFDQGDLIYVKILNDKGREELQVGDIVTFYDSRLGRLNTHRIVEISEDRETVVTQGDKPGAPKDQARSIKLLKAKHYRTVKGGGFLGFLNTQLGFGLLIVLPVFVLFVLQGFRFYTILKENKKEQQAIDLEIEKEKIRAQILAEMAEEEKKKDENKE